MVYDLHSHSTASDGTLTPSRLVERAAQQGVGVLALTDHDTTAGLAEARQAASDCGVKLVSGVEISVTWDKRTIHILGLDIDEQNPVLQRGLEKLREFRVWRAGEIARRLEKAGIAQALEGARRFAGGQLISRTHFARFLVECGRARSVQDVFRRFLVNGKPGHVPGKWAPLAEVIGWIRAAGGHAVIAHPARYRMTATRLRKLIQEFKDDGGSGIEVVSGSHGPNDRLHLARYAQQYDLYASSGSDFHGPENPWIELGHLQPLPSECRPIWTAWS